MIILALHKSGARKHWNKGTPLLMTMQNISAPRLNQDLSVPKKPGQIKSESGSSLRGRMQIKKIYMKRNKKEKSNSLSVIIQWFINKTAVQCIQSMGGRSKQNNWKLASSRTLLTGTVKVHNAWVTVSLSAVGNCDLQLDLFLPWENAFWVEWAFHTFHMYRLKQWAIVQTVI